MRPLRSPACLLALVAACSDPAPSKPVPDAPAPPVAAPAAASNDAVARRELLELVAAMGREPDPEAKVAAALAFVDADPARHPVLKDVLGPVLRDIDEAVARFRKASAQALLRDPLQVSPNDLVATWDASLEAFDALAATAAAVLATYDTLPVQVDTRLATVELGAPIRDAIRTAFVEGLLRSFTPARPVYEAHRDAGLASAEYARFLRARLPDWTLDRFSLPSFRDRAVADEHRKLREAVVAKGARLRALLAEGRSTKE